MISTKELENLNFHEKINSKTSCSSSCWKYKTKLLQITTSSTLIELNTDFFLAAENNFTWGMTEILNFSLKEAFAKLDRSPESKGEELSLNPT